MSWERIENYHEQFRAKSMMMMIMGLTISNTLSVMLKMIQKRYSLAKS